MTALHDTTCDLTTVVGIPVLPYRADGSIDDRAAGELAARLVDAGLGVLTPNGNTGEFYALSPTERRIALHAVLDAVRGRARIVAGVGLDLDTATTEARAAVDAGADAVMVHQPVLPYLSPEGWVDYVATVASAVPENAVLPYVSSPIVQGAQVTELVRRCPNVVGLKYSVPDPVAFARTVHETEPELLWIAGLAESYAPSAWQSGARAFTSGLVNVAPHLSLELLEALRAGDLERISRLQGTIREFEAMRSRNRSADNVSVVKEAMHQLGLCDRSVRPPSSLLREADRSAIGRMLEGWGIAA
ncbi:dihydrodipicolinate synthase family protein [Brachybacterium ginsengisoli]|uniref:Dihydrodipicolinate synthase family protein n=1 Tax=Brachybacterium ginsengisoli TaxID=1331682 RepID=A0A291H0E8_9MICO|nr:dihydrodipicolinate synthase family protein [Brachybacterium ginsengisoli]ATG55862.1 dihydrodipicolinate synthase family protein [Brachybacterium ginsengisoli]